MFSETIRSGFTLFDFKIVLGYHLFPLTHPGLIRWTLISLSPPERGGCFALFIYMNRINLIPYRITENSDSWILTTSFSPSTSHNLLLDLLYPQEPPSTVRTRSIHLSYQKVIFDTKTFPLFSIPASHPKHL